MTLMAADLSSLFSMKIRVLHATNFSLFPVTLFIDLALWIEILKQNDAIRTDSRM